MQRIIHANLDASPGEFEIEEYPVKIVMNRTINHIQDNLIVKNPSICDINFTIL